MDILQRHTESKNTESKIKISLLIYITICSFTGKSTGIYMIDRKIFALGVPKIPIKILSS